MKDLGIVENWTCDGVGAWLESKDLGEYVELLCEKHKVDGKVLLSLSEEDLKGSPVNMVVLGDVKRLIQSIDELRNESLESSCSTSFSSSIDGNESCDNNSRSESSKQRPTRKRPARAKPNSSRSYRSEQNCKSMKNSFYERLDSFTPEETDKMEKDGGDSVRMSELSRTMISMAYLWSSLLFTSFVMTLAHDRVPDMKTYPPLPDIVLDNIPLIPWAFELCEVCALVLGLIWLLILFFHKYRLILIRRMCALSGTIFLLRAFTMYVTSMSVPGVHLECTSLVYGTFSSRFKRALEIFFGMGMSLSGVRTCGDYMFSGHTSVVTLLNFLVTEYTPRRWYFFHTFCWLLNAFAIFFILAAHEHYTIDVVIAFYISSRLFLYYHTLACAPFFHQSEIERTRIWFPLFWFFESDSNGRIPNEFEWPFKISLMNQFVSGSPKEKKND